MPREVLKGPVVSTLAESQEMTSAKAGSLEETVITRSPPCDQISSRQLNLFYVHIAQKCFYCFFPFSIWGLLEAEHSEMSELCVQILVHCICLPYGAEKLCDEVENAFSDDDWRERFSAVEKVAVIARFLEKEHIKANNIVMSALAHCFTYLVGAVEDVCTPVHLRYKTEK